MELLDFFYVLYSTLLHVPPLAFPCIGGCLLGLNPGLLRLWRRSIYCIRQELIHHNSARSHPHLVRSDPPWLDLIHSFLYYII